MENKDLLYRYISLFFAIVLIVFYLLNTYEDKEVKRYLKDSSLNIKKSYDNAYEEAERLTELVFYNNLLYDEKIIEIYKNISKNKELSRKELYKYLKDEFFYLKSFGIKQINFYLPTNETFLRMKTPNDYGDILDEKVTLQYVNSTLKDITSIEVGKNYPSIRFIKPILDENLKHIGSIEIGYSFDFIASLMEKNLNYNVFFIYKKNALNKKKNFKEFILNKKYEMEKNVYEVYKYKEDEFSQIKDENKQNILKKMNYLESFSLSFEYKNNNYPLSLIPLSNALTKENNVYLVAYGTDTLGTTIRIIKYFIYILVVLIILIFIILSLFYILNLVRNEKKMANEKYHNLLNAIDRYVVMVETNKNGYITSVTQAFCEVCGYRKNELLGENMNIIRHPDVSDKFFEGLWKKLKTSGRWEGEIKNLDKNGNSYWIKGAIFPRYNLKNEIIGYLSIRVNITDAKQLKKINGLLKEDLSNKLYEIKKKDKSLMTNTKVELMGKILDSVAHQWKAPISSISIELANLSARIETNNIEKETLLLIHDEIEYQLKNLSITLNEFKSFFNDKSHNDKYNITSTIQETILQINDECRIHNIKVNFNTKKEIYCFGIHQELKQIILNILKNSMEQLINNNIENSLIEISVIEDDENVLIKFIDNTKGRTKEIIDKVFASNFDNQIDKDLGINLYIAKLLIEKTGSSIWMENKGENTEIYLKLISEDRRKGKRR